MRNGDNEEQIRQYHLERPQNVKPHRQALYNYFTGSPGACYLPEHAHTGVRSGPAATEFLFRLSSDGGCRELCLKGAASRDKG